jgi:hypothetical protein
MKGKLGVVALALCTAAVAHAGGPRIREQEVQSQQGEAAATLKGKLKGDEVVDYKVRATAGQSMVIQFNPGSPSAYFNVLPPGSETALFIGSTSGNRYEGAVPADGTYTVRVYLMRSAARRNEGASYTLDVRVSSGAKKAEGGPATVPPPAKVDATGHVKCSKGSIPLDQQCAFRVVRDLPREAADVWVARAGTAATPSWRFLRYTGKAFTTDGPGKIEARRQDDNWVVGIDGNETYLLPDALIHGG